jgi:hypothetical protein
VSSASATSSPYPIKQETTQDISSHRHSTPTPIAGSSSLHSRGVPNASTSAPVPNSNSTVTPLQTSTYLNATAYPTPSSAQPAIHSARTPTQASFSARPTEHIARNSPVVGLFTTPLQSLSSFGQTTYSPNPAHQVSEPELVGIRTTTTSLNSIASMI